MFVVDITSQGAFPPIRSTRPWHADRGRIMVHRTRDRTRPPCGSTDRSKRKGFPLDIIQQRQDGWDMEGDNRKLKGSAVSIPRPKSCRIVRGRGMDCHFRAPCWRDDPDSCELQSSIPSIRITPCVVLLTRFLSRANPCILPFHRRTWVRSTPRSKAPPSYDAHGRKT